MADLTFHYRWLGMMDYDQAWQYQEALAEQVASGQCPPTLLLLEHPPTYTFGRRGNLKNLLWDEKEVERRGIQVRWVDRGGDITYHGPGQLVGYPILPLQPLFQTAVPESMSGRAVSREVSREVAPRIPKADFAGYLRKLETVLIQAIASFGVSAVQIPGMTGVWVPSDPAFREDPPNGSSRMVSPVFRKVAAIGVKVDARGVTRHGFALNVGPDLSNWEGIVACGLEGQGVTSLAEVAGEAPAISVVAAGVVRSFGQVFDVEFASSPQIGDGANNPPGAEQTGYI